MIIAGDTSMFGKMLMSLKIDRLHALRELLASVIMSA